MKPNILYLHSHDTGRYIEPYGYHVATPHLQRFAEEGILFRHAFCANPTCSPSRVSLLTSTYPHVSMLGLTNRGFKMKDPGQHLVNFLKSAGYETVLCGMHHESSDFHEIGYERAIALPPAHAVDVVPAACAYLKGERDRDRPFFLSVGFFETHRPFPEPTVDARYVRAPAPILDTEQTQLDMAGFATSAQIMDDGYGQVLAALESEGLAENTLVIVTTDHGPAFPRMKCNLTEHGTGVLLMMRGPGGFAGGGVVQPMVSHMDVFPTLCDVIGAEKPDWLQGKSLLPLVSGEVDRLHERIFTEVNFHAAYEPQRCVRTERYSYIRRFGNRSKPVLPNCDRGISKDLWLDAGWRETSIAEEQLFDLMFDPNETNSVVDQPEYADAADKMRQSLALWMKETADPLLDGPLFAPAGSAGDDLDSTEHDENLIQYDVLTRM